MKKSILALGLAGALPGCATKNMTKLVGALRNDPASFHASITSVYGRVEVTRANPLSNSAPYSISPDGTITVRPMPDTPPVVSANRDDVLLQTLKKVPNQPEVQ